MRLHDHPGGNPYDYWIKVSNGKISFALFDFDPHTHDKIMIDENISDVEKLQALSDILPGDLFPEYVMDYIASDAETGDGMVCFHRAGEFGARSKAYTEEEIKNIRRKKGIFSTNEFRRGMRPNARHHLKIFYNTRKKARLFYKINGHAIQFLQNRR